MSIYVSIDVHRKRSKLAVVTEDGQVQLTRTWLMDRSRCCG